MPRFKALVLIFYLRGFMVHVNNEQEGEQTSGPEIECICPDQTTASEANNTRIPR